MNETRVFMLNGTQVQDIVTRLEGAFSVPRRVWTSRALRPRTAMLCRRVSQRTAGGRSRECALLLPFKWRLREIS